MFGIWPWGNGSEGQASQGTYRNGNRHLIELRKVVKTYHSAAGTFTALKGIDLNVDPGEFISIVGKSGSGKSTAINMLAGIDRPASGEILVGDTAVHKLSEGQMAVWRGRNLGVIFQFFQLLPTLTIVENVMLPMDFCGVFPAHQRRERAMDLLRQVELAEHAHKLPAAVSGGQQQRAAIARALANDPPILVADEPTGNLDSRTANSVFELFEGLVDSGKTILMVTHDIDLAQRVTRTVTLADGEIVDEVRRDRRAGAQQQPPALIGIGVGIRGRFEHWETSQALGREKPSYGPWGESGSNSGRDRAASWSGKTPYSDANDLVLAPAHAQERQYA